MVVLRSDCVPSGRVILTACVILEIFRVGGGGFGTRTAGGGAGGRRGALGGVGQPPAAFGEVPG